MISAALHETSVAAIPVAEMSRLFAAGHSLLPLGGGDDGKSPLVSFAGKRRLPAKVVIDRMNSAGSAVYGIRLDRMMVIDADTDNAATREYVEHRFGVSPVTVRTPRGRHWYFQHHGPAPRTVRDPSRGIAIDFKAGANAYVAGPGSVRPDAGIYIADGNPLGAIDELPAFADRQPDKASRRHTANGKIAQGERTFALWEKSREFAECADSQAELEAELRAYADWFFEDGHNYADADIAKSAKWAWEKRLSNDLYGGEKSAVKIYAHEFERLTAAPNGSDALALLWTLRHNHGGRDRKGKPFAIATRAMAEANTIAGWNASRYHRAKVALEEAGLIRAIRKGHGFRRPDGTIAATASAYVFANPQAAEQLGGGVSSYIDFKCETRSSRGSNHAA